MFYWGCRGSLVVMNFVRLCRLDIVGTPSARHVIAGQHMQAAGHRLRKVGNQK